MREISSGGRDYASKAGAESEFSNTKQGIRDGSMGRFSLKNSSGVISPENFTKLMTSMREFLMADLLENILSEFEKGRKELKEALGEKQRAEARHIKPMSRHKRRQQYKEEEATKGEDKSQKIKFSLKGSFEDKFKSKDDSKKEKDRADLKNENEKLKQSEKFGLLAFPDEEKKREIHLKKESFTGLKRPGDEKVRESKSPAQVCNETNCEKHEHYLWSNEIIAPHIDDVLEEFHAAKINEVTRDKKEKA